MAPVHRRIPFPDQAIDPATDGRESVRNIFGHLFWVVFVVVKIQRRIFRHIFGIIPDKKVGTRIQPAYQAQSSRRRPYRDHAQIGPMDFETHG
jgi:hypothetical protein